MKKGYLIVALSIILLLSISLSVQAGFEIDGGVSYNRFNMEDFNNFLDTRGSEKDNSFEDYLKSGADSIDFDELKGSLGAEVLGRYWFNEMISVGGGLEGFLISASKYKLFFPETDDHLKTDVYDEKFKLKLSGALSEIKVKALEEDKVTAKLNAIIGKYYSSLEWKQSYNSDFFNSFDEDYEKDYTYTAESWGAKFGSQFSYQISDTTNLDTTLNYRILVIDDYEDDEGNKFFDSYNDQVMEFDFSGLELKSSLSIKF